MKKRFEVRWAGDGRYDVFDLQLRIAVAGSNVREVAELIAADMERDARSALPVVLQ